MHDSFQAHNPKPVFIMLHISQYFPALVAELPADEANKVKVAFAEGYIAANPSQAPGTTRTYRWLRTLQQVLAIAVFTAILASLMGMSLYFLKCRIF
jgi:hypothetical protein